MPHFVLDAVFVLCEDRFMIINTDVTRVSVNQGEFAALSCDVARYEALSMTALSVAIATHYANEGRSNDSKVTWPQYWRTNHSRHTLVVVLAGIKHPVKA